MWLFVAKSLLNAMDVINLPYDKCACSLCFWVEVPFCAQLSTPSC